jgi:CMP-2-keto-3-deoxyoctulosonic acid synthetase
VEKHSVLSGAFLGLGLLTVIVPAVAAESSISSRVSQTINGETTVYEETIEGNESNQSSCVIMQNDEVVSNDCDDVDFSSIFDRYFGG